MAIPHSRVSANPWLVLAVFCLGLIMTLLDLTSVNIAIPNIIDGLHASLDQMLWVLNAYSLVYVAVLITAGRLGDIFGPRNVFSVGTVLFTIASAVSGLSHTGRPPSRLWWRRTAARLQAPGVE